mmetsp:Transcript_58683/g.127429  ORF Transcript_58683/g.127429 Transcript_58683/m.127429 type:complete len:109 (-) Transcript_58683:192-518(-)|eukprot:CAMPEP_0116908150 /NCGR_PEP_ID=MMETSP0467-20121206/13526_1 /TAXON_ID=283647 /ORGANISM="Mesodinium pulex, Strain SPMC105" /LENGTH=108 /DNA_ID=CAMNT_0004583297 /DNA_START=351 /DNA_END=677 /DNA_ORIENTATION=+
MRSKLNNSLNLSKLPADADSIQPLHLSLDLEREMVQQPTELDNFKYDKYDNISKEHLTKEFKDKEGSPTSIHHNSIKKKYASNLSNFTNNSTVDTSSFICLSKDALTP